MSRIMNEESILNVIWGATLLGGGGGGSIESGMELLETYKKNHPDKAPEIELITYDEMEAGTYAAVTAGMGSPQAIVGKDFSVYAQNAFKLLQKVADDEGKVLKYSIPVEMGGFNTFVPMMISLETGLPFVDADGAGRAVPALETLLLNVNGCATSPLAMANDKDDQITIKLADPYDAPLAEKLGRDVCIEFGMLAGLSGWMVSADEIKKLIVDGSVTLAEKIGAIFRGAEEKKHLLKEIDKIESISAKEICEGQVVEVFTDTSGGFDYGRVVVDGGGQLYKIDFQNENLLLSKEVDGTYVPMMTVPDIICMYCLDANGVDTNVKAGMPLSNADVKEGMQIALGIIKVDKKWFADFGQDMKWWTVWNEYMKNIKYTGENIRFDDVKL